MANSGVRLASAIGVVAALWANPVGTAPRAAAAVYQPSRPAPAAGHVIQLRSRAFAPGQLDASTLRSELALLAREVQSRIHFLVQLDFIPSQAAVAEYEKAGVRLLAYVPDYAWIASAPAENPTIAVDLPGLTWAGALAPDDKIDPDIRSGAWGSWNLASDGTVAIVIVMHKDETLETGRSLAAKYGGRVTSQVEGLRALLIELPGANVASLAGEDAIQWIEPAEPPLSESNDGIRQQIGVNTVQAAPYNLDGSGVQILIYDTGIVTPTHADFSGRITIGANDAGMTVSEHSTHVAGTAAGSGNRSVAAGGTSLQWRGMAPGAGIISYAYDRNNTGMLFYNDPGDIENNWAAAQNTHGADIGNASLGSNIYANYPLSCTQMGNYGLTSGLMDQIIRGGNSVVGTGDKFIATWAAGNERPSACGSGGYGTLAPPASAKNPIHVGASNTNDNSMTSFSSWGPTDDGRIKPIVVAGGDQIGGDGGIMSTIPRLFVNRVTALDCDGSGDDYCYPYDVMRGTSMAAPAVAGSIALMLQEYRQVNLTSGNFWPASAKAILIQTANDFGNPGPDYKWGFGQIRVKDAVDLIARHGFFQNSVDQDETDLFIVQVTDASTPQLQISLAWDDYEATFNANPTLINDLDVELVAPSGAVWRPWVLDPANPANNATRGVNTRDNQEQVTVPDPELGTWLVRVKGKTVPEGPQDYAIACDGCRIVVADVCQATAGKAPVLPALTADDGAPSNGEVWQRGLGAGAPSLSLVPGTREDEDGAAPQRILESPATVSARNRADRIGAEMLAFDVARNAGPAAVLAFADKASTETRAMIASEVDEARARFRTSQAPASAPAGFVLPWVGVNGACAYYSVQAAIDAAPNGATVRVSTGFFAENLAIGGGKVITVEGGWGTLCTAPGAQSRIDAASGGSVIEVTGGARVKLSHLELGWGTGFGAGLDVLGGSAVTLDDTSIVHNNGSYGGGLYIGSGSEVTLTNGSFARYNTASGDGGGAIVYGRLNAVDTASDITGNCAVSDGGGVAVSGGQLYLNAADVTANEARGAAGRGGGIYATYDAVVTLTNGVFIG
ncbi:MAG: S8 family serine peptidase, partial [Thermoflexales bacterium]